MALITCPECGGTVSNTAETCPHCGFRLITDVIPTVQTTTPTCRSAYDVMLVDYCGTKFYTKRELAEILDCSQFEAKEILEDAPVYLYNDISYVEARNIAEEMQECGMRVAVYSPNGDVEYFTPTNYSLVLPILSHILRRPRRVAPPRPRRERMSKPRRMTVFNRRPQPKPIQNKPAQVNHNQPKPTQQNHAQPKPTQSSHSTPSQAQPRPAQNRRPSTSAPKTSVPHGPSSRPSAKPNNSKPSMVSHGGPKGGQPR